MRAFVLTAFLLAFHSGIANAQTPVPNSLQIPPGTILPVRLNHALSSKSASSGQAISARIMQDVPLPNHEKIPEGATVSGTVVSVTNAAPRASARISLRFDTLQFHHHSVPIVTNLRAIAGFMEVQAAQTPETSLGFGTPYAWATTRQIGGDEVYGVAGPVADESSNYVGKSVAGGGVLVHVSAHPNSNCRGPLDDNGSLQALWVFSSDACGVYGIDGLAIAHAGRTSPTGEIVLTSNHGDVLLRSATAMLLRTIQ